MVAWTSPSQNLELLPDGRPLTKQKRLAKIGKKFERGDYTLMDIIQMVLASGWVSVCSVYSAIIHFLNSDIIMLDVLKSKCRQNGNKTKWE